jgi:hypothetical protein
MLRYVRVERSARSFTRRAEFANTFLPASKEAGLLRGRASLRMALTIKGQKECQ